ncbi:VUT family protein [Alcaligenaceae bacterium]|nr:VUT family protein [Alcaligenaceae bacterium]
MTAMQFSLAVLLMAAIVVASNILVQYPINRWLTWGAISYPIAFLVADLLNRRFGPSAARKVAYVGFVSALIVSVWVATPRIAIASGLAFLTAQLVDIYVFDRLRNQSWWRAPLLGGVAGATLDTFVFFSVAFVGTGVLWPALLVGDLAVKLVVNTTMLAPFRALMWNLGKPTNTIKT